MSGHTNLQNLEAERSTLGGMLLAASAIEEVLEVATREDFYLPKHQHVFDAIVAVYERGEPADAVTVARELSARGELSKVGGVIYLHELMESTPSAANAAFHAQIVAEKGALRRIYEYATRTAQMALETDGADIEEIVARIQEEAFSLTARRDEQADSAQADSAERFTDSLEKPSTHGVMTGFKDLDALTNGFKPGQLIIIGARPSVGKTTLCLDILRHISIKQGGHSAFFSLEMTHDELTARMFSAEARIPFHRLRFESMTDDDWSRIGKHYADVAQAAVHIDDSPGLNFMQVVARSRKLARRVPLKVIAVDYFQMLKMGTKQRYESREREAADIIYGLKNLGKLLNVPVIALAQLNRGVANRADKTPQMSDIRETGVSEQACDIGILIHREDADKREHPRAGEADLIVAKHRGGPKATITVAFQGHFSRFVDMQGDDYRGGAR